MTGYVVLAANLCVSHLQVRLLWEPCRVTRKVGPMLAAPLLPGASHSRGSPGVAERPMHFTRAGYGCRISLKEDLSCR